MAKQFMNPPVQPILDIKRVHSRYCNACGYKSDKGVPATEIQIGMNNRSVASILCDACLEQLSDNLWQYLEENI